MIGNGAVAQAVLSKPPDQFGTFRSINIGYGLGLMIAVYVSIGVSGGHLNPAVTLAMALRGKMKWLMVILFTKFFYYYYYYYYYYLGHPILGCTASRSFYISTFYPWDICW